MSICFCYLNSGLIEKNSHSKVCVDMRAIFAILSLCFSIGLANEGMSLKENFLEIIFNEKCSVSNDEYSDELKCGVGGLCLVS